METSSETIKPISQVLNALDTDFELIDTDSAIGRIGAANQMKVPVVYTTAREIVSTTHQQFAMTPIRALVAACLLWTAASAQVPKSPSPPAEHLRLRGRVVAASSGNGLSRARVAATADGVPVDTVFTDDEGRFVLLIRRSSTVVLAITKAGYAARRLRVSRDDLSSGVVADVELERGSAIAGHVVEASGRPAAGTIVTARRVDGSRLDTSPAQLSTETDDRGEYRIGGLAAGRYVVAAGASGLAAARVRSGETRQQSATARHAKLSAEPDAPPPMFVELGAGDERSSVNQVLGPQAQRENVRSRAPRAEHGIGRAAVVGRVLSDSGELLADANVRLLRSGIVARLARSDEDGHFAITHVPPGSFTLQGATSGYVTVNYGQQNASQAGRTIRLRDGETLRGIEIVLPRGGIIAGTVMDEHGDPIEGAVVRALQVRYFDGRMTALRVPGVQERRSDDRGHYRLFGLLPGKYIVAASVDAALSTPARAKPQGYAPSFFPGTSDIRQAWPLQVEVQRDVFGANVVLARSPAVRVSGVAFNSKGEPLKGTVLLALSRRSRNVALEPLIEPVGGSFLFTNVPPGEYVIQAIGRDHNPDLPPEFTSQFLTVSEIDTAPLVLVTSPGANLTGRIVIEGHSSSQPVSYSVRPVSADFDFAPLIGRGAALEITRQGRFQISGLFGPTRFMLFGAPAGWYLKSAVINGQDTTDRPFDFGRGSDLLYSDARIVISTSGATIHGRVTDGKSDPVSDYTVVVFSADRIKWFDHSEYVKFARPSQDDSFEVTGLPPDDYFVVALDSLDATTAGSEWHDPHVLENLRRLARRLTVSEGDLQQLELPLTRR